MKKCLKAIFRYGLPIIAEIGSELTAGIIISLLIGRVSTISVSAYHIAHEYMVWLGLPAIGLTASVSINIARQDNPRDHKLIIPTSCISLAISSSITLLGIVPSIFLYRELCELFLNENNPSNVQIINRAQILLPLVIAIATPLSWTKISAAALRGLKETMSAFLISAGCAYLISIGLGALMYALGKESTYIIFMQLLGITTASIGVCSRWLYKSSTRHYPSHQLAGSLSSSSEDDLTSSDSESSEASGVPATQHDNNNYFSRFLSKIGAFKLWERPPHNAAGPSAVPLVTLQ